MPPIPRTPGTLGTLGAFRHLAAWLASAGARHPCELDRRAGPGRPLRRKVAHAAPERGRGGDWHAGAGHRHHDGDVHDGRRAHSASRSRFTSPSSSPTSTWGATVAGAQPSRPPCFAPGVRALSLHGRRVASPETRPHRARRARSWREGFARVTPGLFEMLGRCSTDSPAGCSTPRKDAPGTDDRVLLSEDLLALALSRRPGDRRSAASPSTANRSSVVGILPSEFRFPSWNTVIWQTD